MKALEATRLLRNRECEARGIAFPMGKTRNLFFHPGSWELEVIKNR